MTSSLASFADLLSTDVDHRFTMAFQPIVDAQAREVFAYEALVRGEQGEGAAQMMGRAGPRGRFAFHEACRVRAIEMAALLDIPCRLSLNVTSSDVLGHSTCFRTAIDTAKRCGLPVDRLIFEITDGERAPDMLGLARSFRSFQHCGITSAIDDFGREPGSFDLLAAFRPDFVKIDMALVRDIHLHPTRHATVQSLATACAELKVRVVAKGVESAAEAHTLQAMGIRYFQGFLFAAPEVASLPAVDWAVA